MVSAGHIHNYERFLQDGVTYLVSGGGGAMPYEVDRTAADLYQTRDFRTITMCASNCAGDLSGEMIRLQDYAAAGPARWQPKDRFEITLLDYPALTAWIS